MTAIRKLTQQPNYLGDTPPPLSFKEWKARPSIDSGHTADLKFDNGTVRVWVTRLDPGDFSNRRDYENEKLSYEKLVNGSWEPMGKPKSKAAFPARKGPPPDEGLVTDLQLSIENFSELERQRQSILENLRKKFKSGKYDPAMAPKLWMYWVEAGVRQYAKETREPQAAILRKFPTSVRQEVATRLAREAEEKTVDDGGVGMVEWQGNDLRPVSMPPGTRAG
jgi:hypothetical protein